MSATKKKYFIWVTLISLGLLILQALLRKSPELLGQDFGDLNKLVIKMYPITAAKELGKIFGLTWLSVCYYFVFYSAVKRFFLVFLRSYEPMKIVALSIGLFLGTWILFYLGSALYYPALFESLFPLNSPTFSHITLRWANPNVFYFLGIIILLLPLVFLIYEKRRKNVSLSLLILLSLFILGHQLYKRNLTSTPEKTFLRPHIILIAIDSLRFDRFNNPNIFSAKDTLSSLGKTVEFKDHIVGIPRTFPSWGEILSGRYAMTNHLRHMFPNFKDRFFFGDNLVSVLKNAGYNTSVFSDFAGDIFPRFDIAFDKINTPNMTIDSLIAMNIDLLFPLTYPWLVSSGGQFLFPDLKSNPAFADPSVITTNAEKYILTQSKDSPVFSILFFSTAHFPYAAPYPYYQKFAHHDYEGRFTFQKNPSLNQKNNEYSPADISQIRSLYDGAINSISESLESFFTNLDHQGILKNSIVIITADHGEDLLEEGYLHGHGEHLRGENVLKVPFLIKLPDAEAINTTQVSSITRSIDIAPTILKLAHLKFADQREGHDLSHIFLTKEENSTTLRQDFAYSETGLWFSNNDGGFYQKERLRYPNITGLLKYDLGGSSEIVLDPTFETRTNAAKHRSITSPEFRLIYVPTKRGIAWELFNRQNDPSFQHNIASEHPEIVASLKEKLFSLIKKYEPEHSIINDFVVYHD